MTNNLTSTAKQFLLANSMVSSLLGNIGISTRELRFVLDSPGGVSYAAVHYNGGHIAINLSRLVDIDLSVALAILLHEYAHIKLRTTADGRFVTVDQKKNSVAEENYCDWYAAYLLRILNFSCHPYRAFLQSTKNWRDNTYPKLNESLQTIQDGFNYADAAIKAQQSGRRANREKADWTTLAACTGIIIFATTLSEWK